VLSIVTYVCLHDDHVINLTTTKHMTTITYLYEKLFMVWIPNQQLCIVVLQHVLLLCVFSIIFTSCDALQYS